MLSGTPALVPVGSTVPANAGRSFSSSQYGAAATGPSQITNSGLLLSAGSYQLQGAASGARRTLQATVHINLYAQVLQLHSHGFAV